MDVFSSFPNGIVRDVWQIGSVLRGTVAGDVYAGNNYLDVIVEEASGGELRRTPDADELTSDTLIYAKPDQLPTINQDALIAGYMIKNTETGQFYAIIGADIGKNQENGVIEHVELWVRATEALEDGGSE